MALLRGSNRVVQVSVELHMGQWEVMSHTLDDDHFGISRPLPDFPDFNVFG